MFKFDDSTTLGRVVMLSVVVLMLGIPLALHLMAPTKPSPKVYMYGAGLLSAVASENETLMEAAATYAAGASDAAQGIEHCSPDSLTPNQVLKLTVEYITSHLGTAPSASAASTVIAALAEAYPCDGPAKVTPTAESAASSPARTIQPLPKSGIDA